MLAGLDYCTGDYVAVMDADLQDPPALLPEMLSFLEENTEDIKQLKEKDLTVIQRIEAEIAKIDNKESNIFFFVLDTKGNPSGSLEYIYKLAMILKENEYNVTMLYQNGGQLYSDDAKELLVRCKKARSQQTKV